MKLDHKILKVLLGAVHSTHDNEIACGECFDKIHEFAELELLGKSPDEAMPLVREHLEKCAECKEEYEALLKGLEKLKVYS
ncbi:MAG: hypothetical protein CL670_06540 [Balneola sp.]|jgi:DNA-directed RNA polymerase subunit RPC12/RpoP|nr:hypothetical protein [Balneola sp.]MAL18907.1 hypothetical protein [Balneola sp.]MBE78796.1 hypothetical protein [Balneola sp.]|tara:strand:+ start:366 stop:608 length:243 start_codon:yes stop_codon:yes gene_type:complete